MDDKKENEMKVGIPSSLRGLDAERNSINIPISILKAEICKAKPVIYGSLNDVVEPGEYIIYSTVADIPSNDFYWLKIIGLTDFVQIAISFSSLVVKKRSFINGYWSDWK